MKNILKLSTFIFCLFFCKALMAQNFKLATMSADPFICIEEQNVAYGSVKYDWDALSEAIVSLNAEIVCLQDFSDYTNTLPARLNELSAKKWYCRHCLRDGIILSTFPIPSHKGVFFNPVVINDKLTMHLCNLQYALSRDMMLLDDGNLRNCLWEHVKGEINYNPYPNDETMLCVGQFDDSYVNDGAPSLTCLMTEMHCFKDAYMETNPSDGHHSLQHVYFRSPVLEVKSSQFEMVRVSHEKLAEALVVEFKLK